MDTENPKTNIMQDLASLRRRRDELTEKRALIGAEIERLTANITALEEMRWEKKLRELEEPNPMELSALQRYQIFCDTAPFPVKRLAALVSAVPVTRHNLTLILKSICKEDSLSERTYLISALYDSEILFYDKNKLQWEFYADDSADIRALLNKTLPAYELAKVINLVAVDFARQIGKSIDEFRDLLSAPESADISDGSRMTQFRNFVSVTGAVLKRMGGEYAIFAEKMEASKPAPVKPQSSPNPL